MHPRLKSEHIVSLSLFVNIILLAVLLFFIYPLISNLLMLNEVLPRLCSEQQDDRTILKFCEAVKEVNEPASTDAQ